MQRLASIDFKKNLMLMENVFDGILVSEIQNRTRTFGDSTCTLGNSELDQMRQDIENSKLALEKLQKKNKKYVDEVNHSINAITEDIKIVFLMI